MNAALLLIDLQNDYLQTPGLQPAAGELIERASRLLATFRDARLPIIHAWTTVDPPQRPPMPHWIREQRRLCIAGTSGHRPPDALRPCPGEITVHKTFYSAFQSGELDTHLRRLEIDALVVAGLHLHACIRATVLDAYQRGLDVQLVNDALGSDDPLHAAATRRYLARRAATLVTADTLLQRPVSDGASKDDVSVAARDARCCGQAWRKTPLDERRALLRGTAELLASESDSIAQQLVTDVGKPITEARSELRRSVELLRAVAASDAASDTERVRARDGLYRRRPLGVVGVITPWNNPLAIPVGKIAPALLYGNTVLWKPAVPGSAIAKRLMELFDRAGFAPCVVNLVCGEAETAAQVMADEQVDAVTLSGSTAAGFAAQEICARRRIPLQAELGGNNAAIVWSDADLTLAAREVARGAFSFAGQRCTANRRVVVGAACRQEFVEQLTGAASTLVWGDPMNPDTVVGPLISRSKREQVAALVRRAQPTGTKLFEHDAPRLPDGHEIDESAYYPPTILACDDPKHEIVQEETFGPLLIVQTAASWDEALRLCNGVRQGLVAALFTACERRRREFLERAEAGVLKIGQGTDGAGVDLPFGGWKDSCVGPPEHGPGNREFYTRLQAVYEQRN